MRRFLAKLVTYVGGGTKTGISGGPKYAASTEMGSGFGRRL